MSIYFYYFPIISPLERVWPFILTNLNPLHPGILCAKFGWNWPSGSGEEDENVKSLRTDGRTDGQTDDRWSEKLTWAFSSGKLKKRLNLQSFTSNVWLLYVSEKFTILLSHCSLYFWTLLLCHFDLDRQTEG